jgi:site-specific recombinase XerD
MGKDYDKSQSIKLTSKLRAVQAVLPEFTENFFRGISDTTQIKTRVAYAFDLRIFFYYLYSENQKFQSRTDVRDFRLSDLDDINASDIEKFSEFLQMYTLPHYNNPESLVTYTNSPTGKMRKLSTLRTFYKYYYKKEMIKTNPSVLVDLPEKNIVRLEPNEVVELLDAIESGAELTKDQKRYHQKTALRDLAVISLLLGTGIRISECVGLNIRDFDFPNSSFTVTRKGGSRAILYLPDEVSEILMRYLKEIRTQIVPKDDLSGDAMFLSLQRSRLAVSSIEKMLKKYTESVIPLKNISPHKLRSTYGTNLYRETGAIYLVADVLGHKDVNTTKKHYAAIEEDRRKIAAKMTKLRKD